ncbi:MAG: DUF3990 domain-containing protein, partial [Lachnospiraceae bacterium]|nr:DUF3990 domain-containing protein [Lachnospiraceae bacterium]
SLNRMTEAVMEDGRKLICRYDAEGLRHETEENGRLIRFIYSGRDAVCEEADDNITRYIRSNGRLVASDSENARTYYHYACDSLGSITHVIAGNEFGNEETNGDINSRILCRYKYDAFGNTINTEETITNRYGFTGEMHDDITEMYYLRARYYAPYMGRFTQADTYHGDGLNLYIYAGNNPVKYVDPSGHCCKNNDVNPLPVDENGNIIFYHGTTSEGADSIRKNGVDLNYAIRDMDFGRGFYVTTEVEQAKKWAKRQEKKSGKNGEVVVFEVPASEFNQLNNKYFIDADTEWERVVVDGRNGVQPQYDTVSGPMLRNVREAISGKEKPRGDGQQTTFLSNKSIELLNKYMKGKPNS